MMSLDDVQWDREFNKVISSLFLPVMRTDETREGAG